MNIRGGGMRGMGLEVKFLSYGELYDASTYVETFDYEGALAYKAAAAQYDKDLAAYEAAKAVAEFEASEEAGRLEKEAILAAEQEALAAGTSGDTFTSAVDGGILAVKETFSIDPVDGLAPRQYIGAGILALGAVWFFFKK